LPPGIIYNSFRGLRGGRGVVVIKYIVYRPSNPVEQNGYLKMLTGSVLGNAG